MLHIFQIGNLRVPVGSTTVKQYEAKTSRQFRHAETVASHIPGAVWHGNSMRPLVKSSDYTISGTLMCGLNGCESVDEELQQFLSLSGVPYVPIIAFVPQGDCGEGCPECCAQHPDLWLLTYGEITSVTRTYSYDKIPTDEAMPFELKVRVHTYWEVLDDVRWRYWRNVPVPSFAYDVTSSPPPKNTLPFNMTWNWLTRTSYRDGFEKLRFDPSVFGDGPMETDPDIWVRAYLNDYSEAVPRAFLSSTSLATSAWLDIHAANHTFTVPQPTYSAPPRSLYMLTNLPTSGTISISVNSFNKNGDRFLNTATLNLTNLVTNLTNEGLPTLQSTDRLLFGDTQYPGGGLYRLVNGVYQRLAVFIPWSYGTLYPGETTNFRNKITFSGPDGIKVAYAHIYRRL